MPIRKRISDPFGDDVKRFERRMRDGAPPPAPPKPSAAEREAFVRMLTNYPIGQTLPKERFFRQWADRYQQDKFAIWGQQVYLIPGTIFQHDGVSVTVTHPTIRRFNRDRRGVFPMLRLKGEPRTWYSQVLHWIEDTCYDA